MFSTFDAIQYVDQVAETGNSPILTMCRAEPGIDPYYVKYNRTDFEFAGLISEVICSTLAKRCNLITPDIALIKLEDIPIPEEFRYQQALRPGKIVFGSKVMKRVEILTKLEFIFNKHEFNRLENPLHILRIALFDFWIGNSDRTERNYNLFLKREKKQKLIIYDHFEAFNNISNTPDYEIPLEVDLYNTSFLSSTFAYEMIQWVAKDDLLTELDNFIATIKAIDTQKLLVNVTNELPESWKSNMDLFDYILRFLDSKQRRVNIVETVSDYIHYLPTKL